MSWLVAHPHNGKSVFWIGSIGMGRGYIGTDGYSVCQVLDS